MHETVTKLKSSFIHNLMHPWCTKELYYRSFLPAFRPRVSSPILWGLMSCRFYICSCCPCFRCVQLISVAKLPLQQVFKGPGNEPIIRLNWPLRPDFGDHCVRLYNHHCSLPVNMLFLLFVIHRINFPFLSPIHKLFVLRLFLGENICIWMHNNAMRCSSLYNSPAELHCSS